MSEPKPLQTDPIVRYVLGLLLLIGALAGVFAWWLRWRRITPTHTDAATMIVEPDVAVWVQRGPDGALTVGWQTPAQTTLIYQATHPTSINTDTPLAVVTHAQQITFDQLDPAQRHYFKLRFEGGPHHGQMLTVAEREILLEGGVNFRDIGGYRTADGRYTAWGQVYRAGSLSHLTDADRALLAAMNLQTACDLRTPEEAIEAPDQLPDTTNYIALPIQTQDGRSRQVRNLMKYRGRMDDAVIDIYTRVGIDNNPQVNSNVLRHIANATRRPLVVHCTAGKDRTGIAIALLLALLGVPDDTILADYSLSNRHFDVFEAIGKQAIAPFRVLGVTTERIRPLFTANPVNMAATLAYVRTNYGSVEAYLRTQGSLTDQDIDRLRDALLE